MALPIRLEGVTKIFGPNRAQALRRLDDGATKDEVLGETGATVGIYDVSFEVKPGEVFVVMGLSGSGKSTLVRCLNRLIEPTRGSVFVGDHEVTALEDKELRRLRLHEVSMVFQQFALFPHLSVEENVAYGLRVRGMKKDKRIAEARSMLESVELGDYAEAQVSTLSGGMQQRVGLARALATDPEVLLMDEPFSALDPLIRREMQNELTNLQAGLSKTIVFITHDLDEALQLGDRIAVMKDGMVHQIGTPEEILRTPATDYVAEFVDGVNPWGVIEAHHIMDDPEAVAYLGDGPRTALHRMRQGRLSSILVMNRDKRFQGALTADAAAAALEADEDTIEPRVERDITTVPPDATLEELVPLGATATHPLPVVDQEGRLLGIVVRSAILNGLTSQHGRSRRIEDVV